jgi:hypothetical protein
MDFSCLVDIQQIHHHLYEMIIEIPEFRLMAGAKSFVLFTVLFQYRYT